MADANLFAQLKPGCIFLNCARGAVNDTEALLAAMESGQVAHAVIDTWEPEPAYRRDLLGRADLGTPHIAGHSFEGKVGGTVMVYREACAFLGRKPDWSPDDLLPEPVVPHISVDAAGRTDEAALWEIVRQVYNIESDDARMRDLADPSSDTARAAHFDGLRKDYPMRREFQFTTVTLENASEALAGKVRGLGFRVA
jgi:erythronate-4-phosphate dehydrogenase